MSFQLSDDDATSIADTLPEYLVAPCQHVPALQPPDVRSHDGGWQLASLRSTLEPCPERPRVASAPIGTNEDAAANATGPVSSPASVTPREIFEMLSISSNDTACCLPDSAFLSPPSISRGGHRASLSLDVKLSRLHESSRNSRASSMSVISSTVCPTEANFCEPKLKKIDRIKLLFQTMNQHSNINPTWTGVAELERLRSHTPLELWMLSTLEETLRREIPFLQDGAGRDIVVALRNDVETNATAIISASKLDEFIDKVFAGHLQVRARHYTFVDRVRSRLSLGTVDLTGFSNLLGYHAEELRKVYAEFGEEIWQAQLLVVKESETNDAFRMFLDTKQTSDPMTAGARLTKWLQQPLQQIRYYSDVLKMAAERTKKNPSYSLHQVMLEKAMETVENLFIDAKLLVWQTTLGHDPRYTLTWNDIVFGPTSIPHKEVERQAAIFDFMRAEMNWVQVLALFHTLFVIPLQAEAANIVPNERLDKFIAEIYCMQQQMHSRHFDYLSGLQKLQRKDRCFIKKLVVPSAMNLFDWDGLYGTNGIYQAGMDKALQWLLDEEANNPAFERFLHKVTFHFESKGFNIYEWLAGPLEYLKRTLRRLKDIRDKTDDDHEDVPHIQQILVKVQRAYDCCRKLDIPSTIDNERRVSGFAVSDFANRLLWSRYGSEVDVAIDKPERRVRHHGKAGLIVTPEREDVHECFVIVLDNYLLITEEIEYKGSPRFKVFRRPIPLHLIELTAIQNNRDFAFVNQGHSVANPIALRRKDRMEEIVFLVETTPVAAVWKRALTRAIYEQCEVMQEKHQFMQLRCVQQFFQSGTASLTVRSNNSAVLLACNLSGCGIFVLRPSQQPEFLFAATDVTQMAVYGDYLVVLAAKCVCIYVLDQLLEPIVGPILSQTINDGHEVESFHIHKCSQEVLIVHKRHKKKKSVDVFELYSPSTKPDSFASPQLQRRFSVKQRFLERRGSFEIPMACFKIISLRHRLALITENGFHFTKLDIDSISGRHKYRPGDLVSLDVDQATRLAAHSRNAKPLTLIKTSEAPNADYLLCFRNKGVYMDHRGRLTGRILEWLSLSVSAVIPYPPFVLVFGTHLIEVRRAVDGKLEQTIAIGEGANSGWKLTWDGNFGRDEGGPTRLHLARPISLPEYQGAEPAGKGWEELMELRLVQQS